MKRAFIAMIKWYQRNISAHTKPCCRFEPTCSHYAIEAIELHGAFKGIGLAAWRILRCNPLCKSGYDPVPMPKRFNKGKECNKEE